MPRIEVSEQKWFFIFPLHGPEYLTGKTTISVKTQRNIHMFGLVSRSFDENGNADWLFLAIWRGNAGMV